MKNILTKIVGFLKTVWTKIMGMFRSPTVVVKITRKHKK